MSENILRNKETKELLKAVLSLKNEDEAARFLRDLLTPEEIREFGMRWKAAQLIYQGVSYRNVAKETGLSTATVTRVARWLKSGMGGYQLVLQRNGNK
jgi:TrpR-related protein YerC/YecD